MSTTFYRCTRYVSGLKLMNDSALMFQWLEAQGICSWEESSVVPRALSSQANVQTTRGRSDVISTHQGIGLVFDWQEGFRGTNHLSTGWSQSLQLLVKSNHIICSCLLFVAAFFFIGRSQEEVNGRNIYYYCQPARKERAAQHHYISFFAVKSLFSN